MRLSPGSRRRTWPCRQASWRGAARAGLGAGLRAVTPIAYSVPVQDTVDGLDARVVELEELL